MLLVVGCTGNPPDVLPTKSPTQIMVIAHRGAAGRAQDKGFRVVAWDIHDLDEMCEAIALVVDGIETNWPGRLKELLRNPGACTANR